jgi:hypothetical protein
LKYESIQNPFIESKSLTKSEIILKSGIIELDSLIEGFKSGEITYIEGNSSLINNIPNQLCVNTFRIFNRDTIYLDGGICADPYQIAKYARYMTLDQNKVLEHVHISRAFTVYQLSTFIEHMLEKEIREYSPKTIIIGCYPLLYLDIDLKTKEAQTLLKNNLNKLYELTSHYNLITVLTNIDSGLYNNETQTNIQLMANETVRMKYIKPCTYVYSLNKKDSKTILNMAQGQLKLERYGLVA